MEFRWHQWPGNDLVGAPGIPHSFGTHCVHSLEALLPRSRPVHMKKLSNVQGWTTHRSRPLVHSFLILLCFSYARSVSLVLSRGVEGGRAIDAVEGCVAKTVVLVEFWFFYDVTAAWVRWS
jgi:hypothetical protein